MRTWKESGPEDRVSGIWRLIDRLWLGWILHKENLIVWMELVCFAARRLLNIDRSVSACWRMRGRHTASTVSAWALRWLVFFNARISAVDIGGFSGSADWFYCVFNTMKVLWLYQHSHWELALRWFDLVEIKRGGNKEKIRKQSS